MTNSNVLLILGSVWPEPASSAAGGRMMQLINLFLSRGWKITFGTPAAESKYSADLASIGVNEVKIVLNDSEFDKYVRELNPAIVLFDRFMMEEQFGWRVAEQCPRALRILDTEDLHCLRRARHQAFKELRKFEEQDLLATDVARREIASIFRSDMSLIISTYELQLLIKQFKIDQSLLHYLPLMTEAIDEQTVSNWPSFNSRNHFVTIGNFLHEPNYDSAIFLKQDIWPHIYGAYPSPKITQLNNPREGFIIKGRAEDALKVMHEGRVCLAPLRFGAGMKGKLLEAMLCGTPSVTTGIGAEAMHGDLEWNGMIRDNAAGIAAAAIELYTDETKWISAQKNGIVIVNTYFLKEEHGLKFLDSIDELQKQLTEHRQKNFIGGMLTHHTMASTKFMSRWIEAKNAPGAAH
jgi:glycosyltransferase involved in cell wall biosynthesis